MQSWGQRLSCACHKACRMRSRPSTGLLRGAGDLQEPQVTQLWVSRSMLRVISGQ